MSGVGASSLGSTREDPPNHFLAAATKDPITMTPAAAPAIGPTILVEALPKGAGALVICGVDDENDVDEGGKKVLVADDEITELLYGDVNVLEVEVEVVFGSALVDGLCGAGVENVVVFPVVGSIEVEMLVPVVVVVITAVSPVVGLVTVDVKRPVEETEVVVISPVVGLVVVSRNVDVVVGDAVAAELVVGIVVLAPVVVSMVEVLIRPVVASVVVMVEVLVAGLVVMVVILVGWLEELEPLLVVGVVEIVVVVAPVVKSVVTCVVVELVDLVLVEVEVVLVLALEVVVTVGGMVLGDINQTS